jgi:CHAT domain-containing protein
MWRRLFPGRDHPDVAVSLNNLAFALTALGRSAEAEPLLRDALRMYARLAAAAAAAGAEGDALTLAASFPLARDAFLTIARLNRAEAAAVYAEVWATKAAVARVAERRALAARAAATNPQAAAVLAELRDVRRRRERLLLAPRPDGPEARQARDAELATLARTITDKEASLRPLLPAVGRLERLAAATPADLRAALPADAAFVDLLAYVRFEQDPRVPGRAGEKRTWSYTAFVVTRGGVVWLDLGPASPIHEAVRLWRQALTAPPFAAPPDLPAKVRELVWGPVRKYLPDGVKVVYVSPDAALTGVPWAAVPGDRPGTIVLEEFAVATVPHGPALLDALWPQDAKMNPPAAVLAVGGVPYGAEPESAGDPSTAATQTRGEPLTDPKKPLSWPDLPGAKAEAERIARRARDRKLDARLLTGPQASADRVLDELAKVRYAHLATHGFFADPAFRSVLQVDPELFRTARLGRERVGAGAVSPMVLSGLVFAGANRPDTPGRGVLTGEALLDRDLSGLELAVLSACETGLGDVAGGEGVFGLQRAFHVSGCRNVVASLWRVPDAATAALMGEFYRALWDDGLPPVLALQQAQLAVYRADSKQFAELAVRGLGVGDKDYDAAQVVIAKAPLSPDGRGQNPPVVWAAFMLSGPGR